MLTHNYSIAVCFDLKEELIFKKKIVFGPIAVLEFTFTMAKCVFIL